MIAKSFTATLLALPASIAVVGLFLQLTPTWPSMRLVALLMIFPIWVGIASASYLLPRTRDIALWLGAASLLGIGAMLVVKHLGMGTP